MFSWRTLGKVVDTFERIHEGRLAIDPSIDVVTTLGLSRENILKRIPHNVRTLKHLVRVADTLFRELLRSNTRTARLRVRRELYRKMDKAIKLAEELSPRIDLLDLWTDELYNLSRQMKQLAVDSEKGDRSAADRERRTKAAKSLRDLQFGDCGPSRMTFQAYGPRHRPPPFPVSTGAARAGRGQPAARGVDRQEVPQSRPAFLGPDSGRQSRPDAAAVDEVNAV